MRIIIFRDPNAPGFMLDADGEQHPCGLLYDEDDMPRLDTAAPPPELVDDAEVTLDVDLSGVVWTRDPSAPGWVAYL
jgi:hypothetical protein